MSRGLEDARAAHNDRERVEEFVPQSARGPESPDAGLVERLQRLLHMHYCGTSLDLPKPDHPENPATKCWAVARILALLPTAGDEGGEAVEGIDYAVLTDADVAMMHHAVTAGAIEVDFSEHYEDDDEATGWHRHQTQGVVRDSDCKCSHGVRNVPAPEDDDKSGDRLIPIWCGTCGAAVPNPGTVPHECPAPTPPVEGARPEVAQCYRCGQMFDAIPGSIDNECPNCGSGSYLFPRADQIGGGDRG